MAANTPPIRDNTWWYSDLNAFPTDLKTSQLWLAQGIFFAKKNSEQFLGSKRKHEYRDLDMMKIDEKTYKEMIDPKLADGSGGKAEHFASDFGEMPIAIHLDNILRAKLDKIGSTNKLQVSEIDKFAKSQKQKDTEKILYQREFRKLINEVHETMGLPALKDGQSVYGYVKSLSEKDSNKAISNVDTYLDYIKNQIRDEQDMVLYQEYIYKGDIERAFELCIEHFLINLNKWKVACQDFNNDIKNFNKACGRWYIDETTGRGTVEYIEPDELWTSAFSRKNGEDIVFWFYEKFITFAEFFRQFGTTLDQNQLKEVFELNKLSGGEHGMSWGKAGSFKGGNAKIRIGYYSCLTQDSDNFSVSFTDKKVPIFQRKPLTWLPDKHTPNKYKTARETRTYNVWYNCYYIPPPAGKLASNTNADWAWQSQYIFNIKKEVDMYRYGIDQRYAKSSLVIYKDRRPSFTDIKEAYMPKIRTAWHKFQNYLVNDVGGFVFAKEFMGVMLNAVDEGNKIKPGDPERATGGTGKEAALEIWKQLRQGGMTMMKMTDKSGNMIADPTKFFINVSNGYIDKAEKQLKIILDLYNIMTMSLAQNDLSEGQDAKPRTPVAGIKASMDASKNGIWFIEFPVREFLVMFGERCVQHVINIIYEHKKLNYKDRWEEMQNVIGVANVLMLEGVEDLKPEDMGITVELEDVTAYQDYIFELANKMADDGEVGREVVGLVINQAKVNWKYAYVLLMIAAKQRDREKAAQEELQHQRAMELQDKQLQTAMQLTQGKGQAKDANIMTQGKVDMMVNDALNREKAETMLKQKQQLLNNKKDETTHKAELENESKAADALAAAH